MSPLFLLTTLAHAGGRVDLTAGSPVDFVEQDLGLLVDADFQPLDGRDRSIFGDAGPHSRTSPGETRGQWEFLDSNLTLRAEGSVWAGYGSASASGSSAGSQAMAFYRAFQTDHLVTVDPSGRRETVVPTDAVWYVSGLYVGRMYEVLCAGERSALEAAASGGVNAVVGGGTLDVGGSANSQHLACGFRLLGLRPRQSTSGSSLFLSNTADVATQYEAEGPTRVVMVRYSKVPQDLMPALPPEESIVPPLTVSPVRPESGTAKRGTVNIILDRIQFPTTKRGGDAWDMMGGAPDLVVAVSVAGVVVYSNASRPIDDSFSAEPRVVVATEIPIDPLPIVWFAATDSDFSESDQAGAAQLDLSDIGSAGASRELKTGEGVVFSVRVVPQ